MASHTPLVRLESLEDRLAPAGLLSPAVSVQAPGIEVAASVHAAQEFAGAEKPEVKPGSSFLPQGALVSAAAQLEVKTASPLGAVEADTKVGLSVLGDSLRASSEAKLTAPPLPTYSVGASAGASVQALPGPVSAAVQASVSAGSASAGVEVGVNPPGTNPPVVPVPPGPPSLPAAPGYSQALTDNRALFGSSPAASPGVAAPVPALFLPGSSADEEQTDEREEEVPMPLPPRTPEGERRPEGDDVFVVGGSEDLEVLPAVIAAPEEPFRYDGSPWDWADDAVPTAELAAAALVTDFQPGEAGEGDPSEADAPVLGALFGEGGLPHWLIFLLAVSALAAGRLALPGRKRESEPHMSEGLPAL